MLGSDDPTYNPFGSKLFIVTPVAVLGPLFFTLIVNVTYSP